MKKMQKRWIMIAVISVACVLLVVLLFLWNGRKQESASEKAEKQPVAAAGDMKDGELVDYEANGMLTLGQDLGRTVTITPTETEVYQSILLETEKWKKKVENGDRVLKGDWISLDYEGYINEQPVDDLNESGAVIRVGDGNLFNAAFERGLMGLKLGETYNNRVSFSEDYEDPEVAGQDVTFSVEVTAKFNDGYAKVMSKNKYKTVEEYFEYAKVKEEQENREGVGDTVWEDLVKDCKVNTYPKGSRKQAFKDQKRSYKAFAEASGQTYEEFIAPFGYTDEDIQSMGDDCVRDRMIAKTIAKKRGLTLSDAEYERYLLAFLEPEEEEDKTLQAMEKRYKQEQSCYPRDDMLIELVKQYISKHAKMK